MSSALNIKTNNKMEKRKLNIAIEVLHDVSAAYAETKEFVYDKFEKKCSKEDISAGEVIYFSLTSLEANIFYYACYTCK